MTVVVARKFGERVLIVADTMLSGEQLATRADRRDGRFDYQDSIPGQLKVIVLAPFISIAYAGTYAEAWAAIKEFDERRDRVGIEAALDFLREKTMPHNGAAEGSVEFIVAFHAPEANLVKISNGFIFPKREEAVLGDSKIADLMRSFEADLEAKNKGAINKIDDRRYAEGVVHTAAELFFFNLRDVGVF